MFPPTFIFLLRLIPRLINFRSLMRKCSAFPLLTLFIFHSLIWLCQADERVADQKTDLRTLKFVHALWRHGVRTPAIEMANEQMEWEQGLGELTKKGAAELFRLGQWIRQRYDGFLPAEYNPFDLYVRSSDFNRTLMSAQALLAGLYPPKREEKFAAELNWRPIPVHTQSRLNDRVIFDGDNCEAMTAEESKVFNGSEAMEIARRNDEFLKFLSSVSGFPKSPLPLREMRYVFDPISCTFLNGEGKQLPKWANETVRQQIRQLYDISSKFMFSTPVLVRFRAGVIFTEMLNRMKAVEAGSGEHYNPRQRLHAYSGHDTTVAGVLSAFGIHPVQFPHFAVLLLVELHHDPQSIGPNSHFVRLFFRNETDSDILWEWPIPDCPAPCSLEQLEKERKQLLTTKEEQDRECRISNAFDMNYFTAQHYITLIAVLSLFSASLVVYIIYGFLAQSRRCKISRRRRWKIMKCNSGESAPGTEKLLMEEQEEMIMQDDVEQKPNIINIGTKNDDGL